MSRTPSATGAARAAWRSWSNWADVARWPARAVEFFPLLGVTQPVRLFGAHPESDRRRLLRGRTADLRAGDALQRCDGPFDELAHTVSVGRITSARTVR